MILSFSWSQILTFFRHEHLYGKVENNVIRSDEFKIASSKANLQGIQVMLCTLSMLSNFNITKFTKEIPLKTLVVDEASQIEIGNYIAPFSSFKRTLQKTCFIGDDKQCEYLSIYMIFTNFFFQVPPHGQEDLKDLQSIFEVSHLQKHVVFLDTQCLFYFILFFIMLFILNFRSYATTNWEHYFRSSL